MYDDDNKAPEEPAWLEKCRSAATSRKDNEAYYATLAEPAFKNHKITVEAEGRYLCQEPGTIIYGFRVVDLPGAILLYGDIGHCIIQPYNISWLRGAVRSTQYVFEKMGVRRTQFVEEMALGTIANMWDHECYKQAQRTWEEWGSQYYREEQSWVDVVGSFDYEWIEQAYDYPPQAYWHLAALRWFCANIGVESSDKAEGSPGRPVPETPAPPVNGSVQ